MRSLYSCIFKYMFHIFRQCGCEFHMLSRDRMNKGETVGMQCLTPDILHVWVVQIISDKRKTNILHVHTDLVCASGFQKERDKAVSERPYAVHSDELFALRQENRNGSI